MTSTPENQKVQSSEAEILSPDSNRTVTNWTDADGSNWSIDIGDDGITLTGDSGTYEIKRDQWKRDIYVATHGESYIIRFETSSRSIGFIIVHDRAHPLLSQIGHSADAIVDIDVEVVENTPTTVTPLLWPKISPLAVWALINSSLVFLPIVGILFAVITIVLLAYHRVRVRPSPAYRHSRMLCRVASIFLISGLIVSMLSVLGISSKSSQKPSTQPATMQSARDFSPPQNDQNAVQKASVLDEEHNWGLIAAALFVVLLSLTVHESAHAITAWWMGDDFAKRLGRVTLNPAMHIDPIGTILLPLVLFLMNMGVFGWAKPVPVRLDYVPNPRRSNILISLAGPGSNLLMAAASMSLLMGIGCVIRMIAPDVQSPNYASGDFTQTVQITGIAAASILAPLCTILKLSFIVNVFLAFFNLIPIPPLDGSWVLENLFPRSLGPIYYRIRPYSIFLFMILIYSDTLLPLLTPAFWVIGFGTGLLDVCTFG